MSLATQVNINLKHSVCRESSRSQSNSWTKVREVKKRCKFGHVPPSSSCFYQQMITKMWSTHTLLYSLPPKICLHVCSDWINSLNLTLRVHVLHTLLAIVHSSHAGTKCISDFCQGKLYIQTLGTFLARFDYIQLISGAIELSGISQVQTFPISVMVWALYERMRSCDLFYEHQNCIIPSVWKRMLNFPKTAQSHSNNTRNFIILEQPEQSQSFKKGLQANKADGRGGYIEKLPVCFISLSFFYCQDPNRQQVASSLKTRLMKAYNWLIHVLFFPAWSIVYTL